MEGFPLNEKPTSPLLSFSSSSFSISLKSESHRPDSARICPRLLSRFCERNRTALSSRTGATRSWVLTPKATAIARRVLTRGWACPPSILRYADRESAALSASSSWEMAFALRRRLRFNEITLRAPMVPLLPCRESNLKRILCQDGYLWPNKSVFKQANFFRGNRGL